MKLKLKLSKKTQQNSNALSIWNKQLLIWNAKEGRTHFGFTEVCYNLVKDLTQIRRF